MGGGEIARNRDVAAKCRYPDSRKAPGDATKSALGFAINASRGTPSQKNDPASAVLISHGQASLSHLT